MVRPGVTPTMARRTVFIALLAIAILLSSDLIAPVEGSPVPQTKSPAASHPSSTAPAHLARRAGSSCQVPSSWIPMCPGVQGVGAPLGATAPPWQLVTNTAPNGHSYGSDLQDSNMVFDAADNYTMIVTWDYGSPLNSTWILNGTTWVNLSIPTPSLYNYSSLVFSPDPTACFVGVGTGCVVLLEGRPNATTEFEWQYYNKVWTNVTLKTMTAPVSGHPAMPPLQALSLVFDANVSTCPFTSSGNMTGCLLAVGGITANYSCASPCDSSGVTTWEYLPYYGWDDSTPYTNNYLVGESPYNLWFLSRPQTIYDPILHTVLLRESVAWYWGEGFIPGSHYMILTTQYGYPMWYPLSAGCGGIPNCVDNLSSVVGIGMAFDAANDFVLGFGGDVNNAETNTTYSFLGDTLSPTANAWIDVTALAGLSTGTKPSPGARIDPLEVYDPKTSDCGGGTPAHGCIILFGGFTMKICSGCTYSDTWRFWLPVTPEIYSDPDPVREGSTLWLNVTVIGGSGHYTYYNRSWENGSYPIGCGTPTPGTRPNQAFCVPVLSATCASPTANLYNIDVTVTDTSGEQGSSGWAPVEVDPTPLVAHFYDQYPVMYQNLIALGLLGNGFGPNTGDNLGLVVWANASSYSSPGAWFPTPGGVQAYLTAEGQSLPVSTVTVDGQNGFEVHLDPSTIQYLTLTDEIEFQVSFACATIHTVLQLNATYGNHQLPYFPIGNKGEFGVIEPDGLLTTLWNTIPALVATGKVTITTAGTGTGPFNDTWSITAAIKLDFSSALGAILPKPLDGAASLIPPVTIKLTATSSGSVTISGSFSLNKIKLTGLPISITPTVSAQGKWQIMQSMSGPTGVADLVLVNLSVSVTITATATFNIPVFGFSLGPLGYVGIALIITFTLGVGLSIWWNENPTAPPFLGVLRAAVAKVEAMISLGVSVAVGLSIGIASVSIGGSLTFTIYLQSVGSFLRGMILNASIGVTISALFLSWSDTLWSGTLFQEGNPTPGAIPGPQSGSGNYTFTPGPRYYNVSGYQSVAWSPGAWNGTLLNDVYPGGTYATAAGPNGTYVLYDSDNVSRSRQQGLNLGLLRIDPSGRTVNVSAPPSTAGEITFSPRLASLPGGSLLALWGALPNAQTSVTSPSGFGHFLLQTSSLSTSGQWTPVRTISTWGYPESYAANSCGSDTRVVYLDQPTFFGRNAQIVEYDLADGIVLANESVPAADRIVSFDCSSGLVGLQNFDGSYSVLNLAQSSPWSVPLVPGYNLTGVASVPGTPGVLALLERNATQSLVRIYSPASGRYLGNLTLGENVSEIQVAPSGGDFVVAASSGNGVGVYLTGDQGSVYLEFLPWAHVIHAGVTVADGLATVVGETQSGNGSAPWRNLTTAFVPVLGVSPLQSTPNGTDAGIPVTFQGSALYATSPLHYHWSGLPPGCASQDSPTLTCAPTQAGVYPVQLTVIDARGLSASSPVLSFRVSPPLNLTALTSSSAVVEAGHAVSVSSNVTGGSGGDTYTWTGLPPGCASGNAPLLNCTPAAAGNFTVGLTVNDSSGASVSAPGIPIQVLPPLFLTGLSTPSLTVVPGSTVQVAVEVSGGQGAYSYHWGIVGASCPNSGTSAFSCVLASRGSYLFTVMVSDAAGSVVAGSLQIEVTSSPSPSYLYAYLLFAGVSALLVANVMAWWWPRREEPKKAP